MNLREIYLRKKYWLTDFLHGGSMWKQFQDVSAIIADPIGTLSHRRQMLADILAFAKANTRFYSSVEGDRLSDFPVISKQTILAAPHDFRVLRDVIPGQIGDVHFQKTSGSTGIPFEFPLDTICRMRRIATIKAANELIGFHSFMPLMHVRAVHRHWNFSDDITFKKDLNILYADNANLTESKMAAIVNAVNSYGIKFIRGYVTALNSLTEYAVQHRVELRSHPTFIAGGERLMEPLRRRVVDVLNCNIISQYANEENGVLGQAEVNQSGSDFRLYLANCYCEILKLDSDRPVDDGEYGRVVITDYTNHAMPMIRYDVGDIAMVGERSSDGEVVMLKALAGRKTDMIYRTDGTPVDMFNSIPLEVYSHPYIRQWQFIQNGPKSYHLVLSASNDAITSETENFQRLVRDVLGSDADVHIEFVSDIPVLNSGKRKVVVQAWKK